MTDAANLSIAETDELKRYLTMFDALVRAAGLWLEKMPAESLEWTPPSPNGIHFGKRLRHASVKTLFAHMAIADNFWAKAMRDAEPGGTIPLPRDMNAFHDVIDGDLLDNCLGLHQETLALIGGYSAEDLKKPVIFAGDNSRWTVMGFLWAAFGHRSYHLGNLDMLIRIKAGDAPDYFAFSGAQMA